MPKFKGKEVSIGKPRAIKQGEPGYGRKKYQVYVKGKGDTAKRITFGDPNLEIKRDNPKRRKSFRARHKCDSDPPSRDSARYWSCQFWKAKTSVSEKLKGKK